MKKNKTGYFQNREIIELLRSFDKKEVKLFTQFLAVYASSPVIKCWAVLKRKHPEYLIKDEAVHNKVRPGKPFHDVMYRGWVSELYRLAKEFITWQEFKQDKKLSSNTTAYALLKRGAPRAYLKNGRQATMSEGVDLLNAQHYSYLHQKEFVNYQYVTVYEHHKATQSLQLASDFHDYNFLAQKLRYLVIMRNRQRIVKDDYNYTNEKDFLTYLAKFDHTGLPLIHTYYLLLIQFQDITSAENYKAFYAYFDLHRSKFDVDEARQVLTFASNICYWNIGLGNLEFLEKRFIITRIMVDEGFIMVRGFFPTYHFRSTMRSAVEAKELEWAAQFLDNYLPQTNEQDRPNLESLNRAYLHFSKGELDLQSQYLLQMQSIDYKFIDPYNEIAYRTLLVKTDFVLLGEQPKPRQKEAFQGRINGFSNYILRKKDIPATFQESCQHFSKALRLIYNKKYGKKRVDKDLGKEILGLQPIIELPWLLELMDS